MRYNGEVTGAFSAGREAFIVLDHGEVAVPTSLSAWSRRVAAWVPARRAASISPIRALDEE